MKHTISMQELICRPIIRNDNPEDFLNKMTDEEIKQWKFETEESLIEEGILRKFPDWNAAYLTKVIDAGILYKLLYDSTTENDKQ